MPELSDERRVTASGGAFVPRAEFAAEIGHVAAEIAHVDRMLTQVAETSLVMTETIELLHRRMVVLWFWLYVLGGLAAALLIDVLVTR